MLSSSSGLKLRLQKPPAPSGLIRASNNKDPPDWIFRWRIWAFTFFRDAVSSEEAASGE
ncbi:hypothetical protein LguiB_012413 [Lonicera macranthoides]